MMQSGGEGCRCLRERSNSPDDRDSTRESAGKIKHKVCYPLRGILLQHRDLEISGHHPLSNSIRNEAKKNHRKCRPQQHVVRFVSSVSTVAKVLSRKSGLSPNSWVTFFGLRDDAKVVMIGFIHYSHSTDPANKALPSTFAFRFVLLFFSFHFLVSPPLLLQLHANFNFLLWAQGALVGRCWLPLVWLLQAQRGSQGIV